MAHPVAGVGIVGIGAVLHMGNAVFGKIGLDLPPGGGEKGPDKLVEPGGDAGEPLEPAPPDQVEEIITGVTQVVERLRAMSPVWEKIKDN